GGRAAPLGVERPPSQPAAARHCSIAGRRRRHRRRRAFQRRRCDRSRVDRAHARVHVAGGAARATHTRGDPDRRERWIRARSRLRVMRPFLRGGEWKFGSDALPVTNPYTDETIDEVAVASWEEIDGALDDAVRSFERT